MSSQTPAGAVPQPDRLGEMIEHSIRDIDIPPRPTILERISEEMRKDEPDFRHLNHIISADVGISAGLIKTANSPYFGVRRRARSVNEALQILGLNVASNAIAGLVLREAFPPSLHLERFWDASARIARLSGWLTQRNSGGIWVPAEDAYTFGLFRDCGIPILMKRIPQYPAILEAANQEQARSFTAIEEDALPTNHAIMGSLLAQSWWLPEEICQAIRHHHSLAALGDESSVPALSQGLIAYAQLAEHLVQQHTGMSLTQEWGKLGPAVQALLKIDDETLESIREDAAAIVASED